MKQEKIKYKDIKRLGFKEEPVHDQVYLDEYGFDYVIITKKLTKSIYIDWAKESRTCQMYRVNKKADILGTIPIKDLEHLEEIIEFFGKTPKQ